MAVLAGACIHDVPHERGGETTDLPTLRSAWTWRAFARLRCQPSRAVPALTVLSVASPSSVLAAR
jgi:hypothetical protein